MTKWKMVFDQPPGKRILRSRFFAITHFSGKKDLWYSEELDMWATSDYFRDLNVSYSNCASCRSFKAFKRHLRKHQELQFLDEVILVSKFVGYDIRAVRQ